MHEVNLEKGRLNAWGFYRWDLRLVDLRSFTVACKDAIIEDMARLTLYMKSIQNGIKFDPHGIHSECIKGGRL